MSIVNIKLIEKIFGKEQKKELLAKVTDDVESVYQMLRDVTFITIDEIREGDWGIGGQQVNAEKVSEHTKRNIRS